MIPATEALERLQDGNRRFIAGNPAGSDGIRSSRRTELVSGQNPFAVILGCSDSRVPAELIFDVGLGDLFVIRVAGNIAAPSHIGSVEYAVERLGARLVVVVGHTMCGAVTAVVDGYGRSDTGKSPNFQVIADFIQPTVDALVTANPELVDDALLNRAVRANIVASVECLRKESAILDQHLLDRDLIIAGAEYCLETGIVEFFDGIPV